jgi:predicted HTH transcriptional regulator
MYNENSIEKLRRLLSQKAEIKNVDYKLTFNWNEASKEDKGKIIKDIIAMTNSKEGGIILFGVSNKDMEPVGMSKEEIA